MSQTKRNPILPSRVSHEDTSRLQRAVASYNAAMQTAKEEEVLLEALKVEIQRRYGLRSGQSIDLETGRVQ